MSRAQQKPFVDQTALRFNQAAIILCNSLAFLLDQPWMVAGVALILLVGTIWPGAGLFKLVYTRLLKPAGLLQPDPQPGEQAPHLLAQGLGALFLTLAALAFLLDVAWLGWLLAGIVILLAATNLFFGFCLGCFLFYQLARRGIRVRLSRWA
ncbi:MAG: DUF4395 domain-containing protein [Caldilineales bacterium]|nr:DUF4395 domain-containing protein [Caldilineales bacterium]